MNVNDWDDWLNKLEHYCAYQERCKSDVKLKLTKLSIPETNHHKLIQHLEENNFLNEERYTHSFVRGKMNNKKDGFQKIKFALLQKGIPRSIIDKAIEEQDKNEYRNNLSDIIEKKWTILRLKNDVKEANVKLCKYLMGKGYSYNDFKPYLIKLN